MALSAGTRLGPYEITAEIGAGGIGVIYRARDTRLQRDVALKGLRSFVYRGFVGYDVAPDGQRFLTLKGDASHQQTSGAPQIVLVQHWFEELKRLVPTP